ncbi:hypothetical protein PAPHI01_0280 [Pancytospora philotis]|nr:hypothetical protein PAPHI01_0280 [Pancytospora philotis]
MGTDILQRLNLLCASLHRGQAKNVLCISESHVRRVDAGAYAGASCIGCFQPTCGAGVTAAESIKLLVVSFKLRTQSEVHFSCICKILETRRCSRGYSRQALEYACWDVLRGLLQFVAPESSENEILFCAMGALYRVLSQLHLFLPKPYQLGLPDLTKLHTIMAGRETGVLDPAALIEIGDAIEAIGRQSEDFENVDIPDRDVICRCFYAAVQHFFTADCAPSHSIRTVFEEVLPRYLYFLKSKNIRTLSEQLIYICMNTAPLTAARFYSSADMVRVITAIVREGAFDMLRELRFVNVALAFEDMLWLIRNELMAADVAGDDFCAVFRYFADMGFYTNRRIHEIVDACIVEYQGAGGAPRYRLWSGIQFVYDHLEPRSLRSVDMLGIVQKHYDCDSFASPVFMRFFIKFYKRLNTSEFVALLDTMDDRLTHSMVLFMCSMLGSRKADMARLKCILAWHRFAASVQIGEVVRLVTGCRIITKDNFLKFVDYVEKNGRHPGVIYALFQHFPPCFYTSLVSTRLDYMIMLCERVCTMDHVLRILPLLDDVILLQNISKRSVSRIFSHIGASVRNSRYITATKIVNCDVPFYYIYFLNTVKTLLHSGCCDMDLKITITRMLGSPLFDRLVTLQHIKRVSNVLIKEKRYTLVVKKLEGKMQTELASD